ncbi:MAG: mechanosensitive ion channel family protein [Paludibacteraceae bacterium]|nr:mechanosensitive ion channel family protein [Paludibacteraceae bacterium]
MKKAFITALFALMALSSFGVLKEKDLEQTLLVLRTELETYQEEQQAKMKKYGEMSKSLHQSLISTMQKSEQTALMLYSQKQDYTFDLAYACHEATNQYNQFSKNMIPYQKIQDMYKVEVNRYNNIIDILETLPPRVKPFNFSDTSQVPKISRVRMNQEGELDSVTINFTMKSNMKAMKVLGDSLKKKGSIFLLSEEGQANRDSCLVLAKIIRDDLVYLYNEVSKDSEHYDFVAQRLKKVNDYALERYSDIKNLIFINGDVNYFKILSRLPNYFDNAKADIMEKYMQPSDKSIHSEWRGPIVIGLAIFVIFYLIVAFALSNVIIRFLLPKRFKTKAFNDKKPFYILAFSFVVFVAVVTILRLFAKHNFFMMASGLLIEYACLVSAVLLSLLVRTKAKQLKSSFMIYTPILLMGFVIIVFRIIFVTNNVVSLIFPPILLLFTILQGVALKRYRTKVHTSDGFYSLISLLVLLTSCTASWLGYSLLAVQIFIWWLFQLMAIQAITCIYYLIKKYEFRFLSYRIISKNEPGLSLRKARQLAYDMVHPTKHTEGNHIGITWPYDLFIKTLVPIFIIISVVQCAVLAAGIFDLSETLKQLFFNNFINVEGVCQLSLFKILVIAISFFCCRFICYGTKAIYKYYRLNHLTINGDANITLANNMISILIWGGFFIFVLVFLKVPKSGISIVTAGLATGVGFAMKDTIENFIYGLSLMAGRVRVGDYVECDGIRGKVDSITYQSTQMITSDGCVMAFLNSALFNKSFKNLTRNHGHEFIKISVGVSYGSDIKQVRKMLVEALSVLAKPDNTGVAPIDPAQGINVILDEFGDNSVNLYVTFWGLVEQKFVTCGRAKEIIYDTLNKHNVEIPFPQRTIYIKEMPGEK